MAKRRKNNISGWDLLLILIFFGIKSQFIIKWSFIIIGIIIVSIINLINWIVKLVEKKKAENNIIKTPFENAKLNINKKLITPIQLEKKKLGVFDKKCLWWFFPYSN